MRHIYFYVGELIFAACGIMSSFAPYKMRKFIIWMNQDPWSKEQVRDNQIMKKSSIVWIRIIGGISLLAFSLMIYFVQILH